jgi:hypothetical protein
LLQKSRAAHRERPTEAADDGAIESLKVAISLLMVVIE